MRNPVTIAKRFILVLFAANYLWAASYFLIYFNPFLFDHGGHLASGVQLFRNGLHHFNDQMFLGNTQNLFYPPLEDFLLGLMSKLTGISVEVVYPIYILVLLFAFLTSLYAVARAYRTVLGVLSFGISALVLFNLNKILAMKYQGWSFFDLHLVGLTSEFLSGVAFFALCRMWVDPSTYRRTWAGFWAAFALLSHVVVGLIALIVFGLLSLRQNRLKSAVVDVCGVLGITAFYLWPFFWYGQYVNSSSIYFVHTWWLLAMMVATAGLAWSKRRLHSGLHFLAIALYSCVTLLQWWDSHYNVNLPFHFYRLAIISFFIFAVVISLDIDQHESSGPRRWVFVALQTLFLSYFLIQTGLWIKKIPSPLGIWPKVHLDDSRAALGFESYGRYWIFGELRAPDMGIDSILMERDPNFRSTKGLFWESAYANPLQSSYLVTMFSPPIVLDYLYDPSFDCAQLRRLADQYFWLYNVKGIIKGDGDLFYLPPYKRECWDSILAKGTDFFRFKKQSELVTNGRVKNVYHLDFKVPRPWVTGVMNEIAEVISPSQINFLPQSGKFPYFGGAAANLFAEAKSGRPPSGTLFVLPQDHGVYEKILGDGQSVILNPPPTIRVTKTEDGSFQIDLPAIPTWFFLKLAPQPGTKIIDGEGNEVPFLRGVPGIISRAKGRVFLKVQPTPLMKFCYGVSLIILFVFCIRFGLRRLNQGGLQG